MPVPLRVNDTEQRFVLLNGSMGNFCLDLSSFDKEKVNHPRDTAWSVDVGHYVAVSPKDISVYRWDHRQGDVESYSHDIVQNNLDKFREYLESRQPPYEQSIVPHVLRTYRTLRTVLGSGSGKEALQAFLYLMACAAEGATRDKLTLDSWGIDSSSRAVAISISNPNWDALIALLTSEREIDGLRPDLFLTLRHAAGRLFQDAHYLAVQDQQVQLNLDGFLPTPANITQRSQGIGVHFTPPSLVRSIVEQALNAFETLPEHLVVYDPAAGSAEFLREVARQLTLRKFLGSVHLIGWDVSPIACDMMRFVLSWEKRAFGNRLTFDIQCIDALSAKRSWPNDAQIILMNPPFVSWEDMNDQQHVAVRDTLGELAKLRPDLASAFFMKAAVSIKRGGLLGTILPASILDSDSASKVRGEVASQLSPVAIARLGSHLLFANAMIDAAYYIGIRDRTRMDPSIAIWADHRSSSTASALRNLRKYISAPKEHRFSFEKDGFSIYDATDLGRDENSWAPRPYGAYSLLRDIRERSFPKVSDCFDVKQGARTGLNEAFLVKKEFVLSLPEKERAFFKPAVVNESINNGQLSDKIYIFYPYDQNGCFFKRETELKRSIPTYYERLLRPHRSALQKRAGIDAAEWWQLTRHRTWQVVSRPKIVSTYFGKAGSFAWDSNGMYIVVQGHGWFRKGPQSSKNFPNQVGLAYLAVLNDSIVDILLSGVSNHVGGGQWNLSKRFVAEMPLPDLFASDISAELLKELSQFGQAIHKGRDFDRDKLTKFVRSIFNVTSPM